MDRLFLLDAYALIFRAYYALIRAPRITSAGFNTSAIFGFVNTLEEVLRKENPSHLAVCFDPSGPTFRNEAFEDYKAERAATPEDIRRSVPIIKEIVRAYGIPVVEVEGYEADDVIGTLARMAEKEGIVTYMMTPDKDFGQLVSPHILQYKPSYRGQDFELRGEEEVCARYGIQNTGQVIDLLALMGDKIDNIPGCPGVGEKTAVKLINEFGSVEHLLESTDRLKGALKKKVEENAEQIKFSKFLATIRTDVPTDIRPADLRRQAPDTSKLFAIFDDREFRGLKDRVLKRLRAGGNAGGNATDAIAPSLFGGNAGGNAADIIAPSLFDDFDEASEAEAANAGQREARPVQALKGIEAANAGQREAVSVPALPASIGQREARSVQALKGIEAANAPVQLPAGNYRLWSPAAANEPLEKARLDAARIGVCLLADGESDALASWVGTALSWAPGEGIYIPADTAEGRAVVLDLFARPDTEKVSADTKRDFVIASRARTDNAEAIQNYYDISLAHYLLQPEMRHSIEEVAPRLLGLRAPARPEPAGKKTKAFRPSGVAPEELAPWACAQADLTLRLRDPLAERIKAEGHDALLYDVEFPLVRILAGMELTGVSLDTAALNEAAREMENKLADLEQEIFSLAGEKFNVGSPAKVGEILFDRLQLDPKAKKTKTGQYSTAEDVLEKLVPKHPVVAKIMEYRALKKLLNTYLTALPAAINPETGKIHTNYNQTVTATGRISSSAPNLQNIPVRDDVGREIRRAFIADPGHVFLSADYSQIELRLVADFAQDPIMLDAFRHGKDIHAITAAKIYHKDQAELTDNERRSAKTANFGILYGISAFGLSTRLNIPRAEAKALIDNYFATFPTIRRYMDDSIEKAREQGYVTTKMGRKRMLPDINSNNPTVRGYAERNAINAPIQGSAADIIKVAMVRIDDEMRRRGMKSKMIMQVHDELNFDVVPEELPAMQELVERGMMGAYSGHVTLTASCGAASNWLDAH